MKSSRPAGVTFIAIGVLMIAVVNWLRLGQALINWNFLASLLPISPLYLAASGLVWGVAGLLLTWGAWRGAGWAARLTPLAAWVFTLHLWLERLFLRQGVAGNGLLFFAGLQLCLLAGMHWVLRKPGSKSFFGYN